MGCSSLLGGSPFASSIAVMPRDQMSACGIITRGVTTTGSQMKR